MKRCLKKLPLMDGFLAYFNATRYQRTYFDRHLNWIQRCWAKKDIDVILALPMFVPLAEGSCADVAKLSLLSARQTVVLLDMLMERTGQKPNLALVTAEEFGRDEQSLLAASKLKELFDTFGSDISNSHNYHFVYGALMPDPGKISALLEIGLGTNQPDVVSTMGSAGKPGASLRAFRQYLPHAQITGADVDRRILFEEDRIQTHFVDQTELASFDELEKQRRGPFDLIIDDGLHSPNANLAVLIFSLRNLKPGGWLVVEDIKEDALPVWRLATLLLARSHKCVAVKAQGALMFLAQRL